MKKNKPTKTTKKSDHSYKKVNAKKSKNIKGGAIRATPRGPICYPEYTPE